MPQRSRSRTKQRGLPRRYRLRVYSVSPCAIGACYGYIPSPLLRLVPATGIFPLPLCDWCPLCWGGVAGVEPNKSAHLHLHLDKDDDNDNDNDKTTNASCECAQNVVETKQHHHAGEGRSPPPDDIKAHTHAPASPSSGEHCSHDCRGVDVDGGGSGDNGVDASRQVEAINAAVRQHQDVEDSDKVPHPSSRAGGDNTVLLD
eukprot:1178351-Prorocentrum_minimum.AAC.1